MNLKKLSQSVITSNDGLKYFMISLRPDSLIGSYYHIISFKLDVSLRQTNKTNKNFCIYTLNIGKLFGVVPNERWL